MEEVLSLPQEPNTLTVELPKVKVVDKSIANTPRYHYVRTQYRTQHFLSTPVEVNKRPIVVKLPKLKRKKDISVSTNLSFGHVDNVSMTLVYEENPPQDIVSEESDNKAVDDCGKDYEPEKGDSEEEEINANPQNYFVNENKYIVFWSCLFPLLKFCQISGKPAFITRLFERGSLLIVSMLCENNHESKWYSQPRVHEMAAGNILLAAAILFTGNT